MTSSSTLIVYVDRSATIPGRLDELEQALGELVAAIAGGSPRLLAYDAYLTDDRRSMTVVHVHPDSASLRHHLRVVEPLLPRFRGLVRLESIDLYGAPEEDIVAILRRKAALLGGASVTVHRRFVGLGNVTSVLNT